VIDCLYNITFILQNPRENGTAFRKSGFKKELTDLDADQKRYGGKLDWNRWIAGMRNQLDFVIRSDDLKMDDVMQSRAWKTLGANGRSPLQMFVSPASM
jgi:hypothetical protein